MQRRSPQSNMRGMKRLGREISSETLRRRQVQGRQETRSRLRVISHSPCSREAFIYSRGLAKRRLLVFLLTGAVVVLFCKQKSKVGRWGICFVLVWFGVFWFDLVWFSRTGFLCLIVLSILGLVLQTQTHIDPCASDSQILVLKVCAPTAHSGRSF